MPKPGKTGIQRIIDATRYSAKGLAAAWRHEAAFRQELILMLAMIPAALLLGTTAAERALMIASCLIVVIVELLNSAIEAVVDRISDEMHPLSGRAKDMGSAAVFMSLMLVLCVWGSIIIGRFVG